MKVLIVDDHPLFRQGLASLLRSEPDMVVCGQASNLVEAIEAAQQNQPDIILMDFSLPDGTGADAARSILAEIPNCKILFLTVHAEDAELFAAVKSGATGFLLKNEPVEKLLEAVRAANRGNVVMSMDMTRRIMKEFSRTANEDHESQTDAPNLTPREKEVLQELSTGASNAEIAATLFVSENTVKRHVHNILLKLNLTNRRQAAKYARESGLN
ncbi:MAG: response regulator transcription factor [Chloroflexi bacterium]|nr:response regulator transcription factor [Chloroflexota bacterium]MBP7041808.1 response regulator transcription factor [Chloroflexota bacterium]